MPTGLWDMGSDDISTTNYPLKPDVVPFESADGKELKGLAFIFTNKRVEDWMTDEAGQMEHWIEMMERRLKVEEEKLKILYPNMNDSQELSYAYTLRETIVNTTKAQLIAYRYLLEI